MNTSPRFRKKQALERPSRDQGTRCNRNNSEQAAIGRLARAAFLVVALAGCSLRGGTPGSLDRGPASPNGVVPDVVQKGNAAQWVQFLPRVKSGLYTAIVAGSDGNMWFLDEGANALVRMGLTGATKEFSLSGVLAGYGISLAEGADGKFYIGHESTTIVRVTTAGKAVSVPIPSGDSTALGGIAPGPDGNVWFTEFNHLGMITPAGTITEYPYPTQPGTNQYGGVTTGSDGNVWFAESTQNAIGRFVPSTRKFTMFTIPVGCIPAPVVAAKDGNVWFACLGNAPLVGSITPSGSIETYAIGGVFNSNETEQFCARGPDGEPWCASGNDNTVFRINTSTDTATTFTPPLGAGTRPDAVAAGPDGNLWSDTVAGTGEINVLVSNPMTVNPTSLEFTAPHQSKTVTVGENGTASWSATSSKSAVASVVQSSKKTEFSVTSVGAGKCTVTISDGAGNSVAVRVLVK